MTSMIRIYIYGSCLFSGHTENNETTGRGGYGVIVTKNGKIVDEISGGFANTTNARMDIIGITEGLKKVNSLDDVVVYLSNGYVVDSLTKGWLINWKRKGFKKIKHVDLWMELDRQLSSLPNAISFLHSRDVQFSPDFKRAEKLAKSVSSGVENLPIDLKDSESKVDDIFGSMIDKIELDTIVTQPILESICVDASSISNPGPTEYRGVNTMTRQILFEVKLDEATNNIGEFLAIVHALAFYKKQEMDLKILYSDSMNAISWVKQKKCKTKLERNGNNMRTFELIQRAITWLETNEYKTQLLKWNTEQWGEIPADYGRK